MSNIYIQEPPSSGKVILKTTVGDIEIELWTKEAPLACRNFIQLCMEKYYNNTIFHRVVKNFIVQGGDPTGTGEGGESIYGYPFKDEFHTRLRFCRRGLVAMANAGKDDNGSQFFFTLGPTQELQNKHTIFGKIVGDTIYNMLKIGEALVNEDDRPLYPQKIISTEVLSNPFDDIVPRCIQKAKEENKEIKKKEKTAAIKNFKLLSFGEEAEEDEEETIAINKKFAGKGKSAHDTLVDPKLSSEAAIEVEISQNHNDENKEEEIKKKEMTERIKNKLLIKKIKEDKDIEQREVKEEEESVEQEGKEEEEYYLGKARIEENKKKLIQIKKDIRDLKREVQNEKKIEVKKVEKNEKIVSEDTKEYNEIQDMYKKAVAKLPKKECKAEFAEQMMKKFQSYLHATRSKNLLENKDTEETESDEDSWMKHKFQSEENLPVLAKDASTKDDDWFEIYDPRNPINKRRRGETTQKSKKLRR